jgi:hypothetical protein
VQEQRDKMKDLADADWPAGEPSGRVRFGALPTQLPQVEQAMEGPFSWYPTLGLGFADAGEHGSFAAFGGWIGTPAPASPDLHQAVKKQFDPEGRLPS